MQLASTLASFRADVTSAMSFGLPKDAVRPLGTLHLTLGVMSLNQDGVERAVDILKGLRLREILAEARLAKSSKTSAAPELSGLCLTIRGLLSMQPAAKASVLYAPPSDPAGVLYDFCKLLQRPFQDRGLMIDENRPLLLHATMVNTVYVKNGGGARGKRREKLTMDAREVLRRYEDHVWAEDMPVTRVALCRMGARAIEGTDDAAYEVEAEVEF